MGEQLKIEELLRVIELMPLPCLVLNQSLKPIAISRRLCHLLHLSSSDPSSISKTIIDSLGELCLREQKQVVDKSGFLISSGQGTLHHLSLPLGEIISSPFYFTIQTISPQEKQGQAIKPAEPLFLLTFFELSSLPELSEAIRNIRTLRDKLLSNSFLAQPLPFIQNPPTDLATAVSRTMIFLDNYLPSSLHLVVDTKSSVLLDFNEVSLAYLLIRILLESMEFCLLGGNLKLSFSVTQPDVNTQPFITLYFFALRQSYRLRDLSPQEIHFLSRVFPYTSRSFQAERSNIDKAAIDGTTLRVAENNNVSNQLNSGYFEANTGETLTENLVALSEYIQKSPCSLIIDRIRYDLLLFRLSIPLHTKETFPR